MTHQPTHPLNKTVRIPGWDLVYVNVNHNIGVYTDKNGRLRLVLPQGMKIEDISLDNVTPTITLK